jgi:chromosome segregation ATPase
MATENAQKIEFDDGVETLQDRVTPDRVEPAGVVETLNPAQQGQPAQERRLQMVRDINGKLGELEGSVAQLTAAFGESQHNLGNTLVDLQRRSAHMTADILKLVAQVDKNRNEQGETTAALEAQLQASMGELRRELQGAGAALSSQQGRIDQLENSQKSLLKLHDGLAALGHQQGDAIAGLDASARQQAQALHALSMEAREQFQVNRTHIDGLQALHREQKQSLQALAADFDLLNDRSQSLAEHLHRLDSVVTVEKAWVRRTFQYVGGGMVAALALVFGVMAYLAYHPVAVPAAVTAQLASINSQVGKQAAAQQAMATDMQNLQGRLATLDASSGAQATQIAQMQKEVQHSLRVLHHIQKSEAAIRREVGGLKGRVDKVEVAHAG